MRNVLKAVAAVVAILALCVPLIFWTVDEAQPVAEDISAATVTVPPTVVVSTTSMLDETTTSLPNPEPSPSTTTTTQPVRITVAAVGDVLPHMSVVNSVRDPATGSYDFGPVFTPIAPYLAKADYAVANLETRFAGPDLGYSGYPNFNSPAELAFSLKENGVDLVATANNHSLDMGWEGIVSTLDKLDAAGLAHVGTYRTNAERGTPVIADIRGIKVAFLNCTADLNGYALPDEHGYAVNLLDVDQVAEDAMMARMWGADVVIALLHYGNEYDREPSTEQVDVSQRLLSRGVDVIIGSHPHVVQPIAHVFEYTGWKVANKYVAYSLGNFVSAQRWRYSDSGLVVYVHIEKRGLRTSVTGISYLPVYVQRSAVSSPVRYRVLPVLPGLEPKTDVPLTTSEKTRMAQVWEELRPLLYSPDQNIAPLDPNDLGL